MTLRTLGVGGWVIGWSLACAGETGRDRPKPPDPPPNAGECASWHGVALPLSGGQIAACAPNRVMVWHDGDPAQIRWDYVHLFEAAGWVLTSPEGAEPTVTRGGEEIRFTAEKGNVVIEHGGGGGGGGPGRR